MPGPVDGLLKGEHHGRQERDAADHADQHALDHHHAQVAAQGEGHEDQRREARDGGGGAADDREEYGIVHRDPQLQHSHQRLGDVGDLAQEHVGAHVVHDGDADAGQEDQRHHEGSGGQHQHDQRQHRRYDHVHRHFRHGQRLDVRDDAGHAADEALLADHPAQVLYGLHGGLGGGGVVEQGDHKGGVPLEEDLPDALGQHLLRHVQAHDVVVPQHLLHVVDALHRLLQLRRVALAHALHDHHREGALAEVFDHDILTVDRLKAVGKVAQDVIVDLRAHVSDGGRHQQRHAHQDHEDLVLCNELANRFHSRSLQREWYYSSSAPTASVCMTKAVTPVMSSDLPE